MNSLLIFMVVTFGIVQKMAANTKRCFCKAVDANNHDNVFHDFGTVEEHSHWLSVGCRRLHRCSETCDRKVQDWLCQSKDECRAKTQGKQFVHYYQASVCGQGAGSTSRQCGCTGGAFNNVPKCQFECLKQPTTLDFIQCFNECFSG